MDDFDKYIKKRKAKSPEFIKNYDNGYEQFKIGALLKEARLDAGLTQEQVSGKLKTRKSLISRI
jgi:HTH-type transcriptional regulator/antitoxin HipB